MIMIRSIVRPEKVDDVMASLMEAGFPGVTKMSVVGRGKQRGIKIGEITYDEIPKEMLLTVVDEKDREFVLKTIMARFRAMQSQCRFILCEGTDFTGIASAFEIDFNNMLKPRIDVTK